MNENVICSLCTVYEHDMDVMLMQAMLTDPEFLDIFINKTDWAGLDLKPVHAEISNSDADLGETDITVILSDGISKFAILIEDKIDAGAQPDQHGRYIKRGNKAVKEKKYSDYKVFIVCPQKYYDNDDEAKKYEHFVSYEECAEHFSKSNDSMSSVRYQEVMQAISKAKKPPQVNLNEKLNTFFRKYKAYQREHFPKLEMTTKETSSGYYINYKTKCSYHHNCLQHTFASGTVELSFSGAGSKAQDLESICAWFNKNGHTEINTHITDKYVNLRINVPILDYKHGWENTPKEDIDKCFVAITKFAEMAKLFNDIQRLLSSDAEK